MQDPERDEKNRATFTAMIRTLGSGCKFVTVS
jgi:hypothetical protein